MMVDCKESFSSSFSFVFDAPSSSLLTGNAVVVVLGGQGRRVYRSIACCLGGAPTYVVGRCWFMFRLQGDTCRRMVSMLMCIARGAGLNEVLARTAWWPLP